MTDATTHRLFAYGQDGTMYVHPTMFDRESAEKAWLDHDDARLDGRRPLVCWFAVREEGHEYGENAVKSAVPFYDGDDPDTILTDAEATVIMDSLVANRDALKAKGYSTPNIESALAKIQRGYMPNTVGITFRHVHAS
jgi:hypothetical protein